MTETPYRLEYYLDDNDNAPFLGWLYSLRDKVAVYRIRARLDRVILGNFGTVKPVGGGISELKIDHGTDYRVYYAMSDKTVVLLLIVVTSQLSKWTSRRQRLIGNSKRRDSNGKKNRRLSYRTYPVA